MIQRLLTWMKRLRRDRRRGLRQAAARNRLALLEPLENRSLLAPLTNSGTASDIVFNLPAAASAVILEDDGIVGNGISQLRSANNTFDTTTFANPGFRLTINRGNATDTITANALPDFSAWLEIGAPDSPFDTATFTAALSVDSVLLAAASTVNIGAAGAITAPSSGAIAIRADNLNIDATASLNAGSGLIFIATASAGRAINLGAETAGQLSLTDAELDRITAGDLAIGDGFASSITIGVPITLDSSLDLSASDVISIGQPVALAPGRTLSVSGRASGASLLVSATGAISVSGGGAIHIDADNVDLDASSTLNAGAGEVRFLGIGFGRNINLGTQATGQLSLTDIELDRITAATIQIGDANSGTITVSAPIDRAAASTTAIKLTAGGNASIVFSGPGSLDAMNGPVTLLTNASGTGAITSGAAAFDVSGETVSLVVGSGGIGQSGGALVVGGTNVNAATGGNGNQFLTANGSVTIDATGLSAGTGTIELGAGTFALGGSGRIADASKLNVNGATFDIGPNNETVDTLTLTSGSITGSSGVLTSTSTIQTRSGLASAILAGTNGLTQTTGGTTTLSGTNTYAGITTISAGTLRIGNGGSTGSLGTGDVVNNGTLVFNRTLVYTVSNVISGSGGVTISSGQVNMRGTNTYTGTTLISGGFLFIGAGSTSGSLSPSSPIVNNATFGSQRSNTITQGVDFASVISGTGGVFATSLVGNLVLNGLNTYTGTTTISTGTLTFNSVKNVGGGPSALGSPTTLANGTIGLGSTIPFASTMIYTGTGDTTNRVVNLRDTLGNSSTIDQSGTGLLKFTSAFTATGASAKTLTLQGSTSGAGEIAGAMVNNSPTNTTSLVKSGAGTWTLSGPNTYTGATTVSAGTLLVNGSITSNVTVASGATLGGTGTINSANTVTVNSGGHLAPGTSTGFLNSGSVILASGSNFDVDLNGATVGTQYDQQNVTGAVTLGGAALNVSLGFVPAEGDSFTIINNDSNDDVTGTFNGLPEGEIFAVTGTNSARFQITYQGGDGNDVVLMAVGPSDPHFEGTPDDDDFLVKRNGANLEVTLNTVLILSTPFTALTSLSIDGQAGNDTLTVDLDSGDAIPPNGISFLGGDSTPAPGDRLFITGGEQGTVTYNYTNSHDGSIVMSNFGTVSYTGLEPITNSGIATDVVFNLQLPAGPNAVILGDDGTPGNTFLRLSGTTVEITEFTNPTGTLTINRSNSGGTITIDAQPDFNAGLTIGSAAAAFGDITFAGPLTLGTNKSLAANATGTISLAEVTSDLAVSGAGAIALTTDRNISLASGSSLESVDGAITLSANQQATPTTGSFIGVNINNGRVQATGTGVVSVTGKGGDGGGQIGVRVQGGGAILGGTSGTLTVSGAGGTSFGGANYGIAVTGAGSTIGSGGANVQLSGQGGGSGTSDRNFGLIVDTNGQVTAGGSGTVSVQGTGGTGAGGFQIGVLVTGTASTITSNGGNVQITGQGGGLDTSANNYGVDVEVGGLVTAGGSGTVTVQGSGGLSSGGFQAGVVVIGSTITSSGGSVQVIGQGGGSGTSANNHGVSVLASGQVTAGGSGTVTVQGTGGASSGDGQLGVRVSDTGTKITSSGGNVQVTGQGGGSGTSANNHGVNVQSNAQVTAGGSGTVTVQGTGGAGFGNANGGVVVLAAARITSAGGNVRVTGQAGGTGASIGNDGVRLQDAGQVTAEGSGTVTVQGTGGSGDLSHGVGVSGAAITSAGGNVLVTGQGGGSAASQVNFGVLVGNSGQVTAGGIGTVTVQGTGGAATGDFQHGVHISGVGSQITSSGGNVQVVGQAGGSGSSASNFGVNLQSNGQVTAGGGGTVTVQGTGGASSGDDQTGVRVADTGSQITSSGGHVQVTGQGGGSGTSANSWGVGVQTGGQVTAGGSGTVTVQGTAGAGSGNTNGGVVVVAGTATITSSGGNVRVTGQGGGTGDSDGNDGVHVEDTAQVAAGGNGSVTVQGTGGSGDQSLGVSVLGATITSAGGNVQVIGQGGNSEASAGNYGVNVAAAGQVTAGGSGAVIVQGTGGAGPGGQSGGVAVRNFATITSGGGDVQVTGQGGGTGSSSDNNGVFVTLSGQIGAGGAGSVTVQGAGGAGTGDGNFGILVNSSAAITTSGGNIQATGIEGAGTSGLAITVAEGTISTPDTDGTVTLIGNSMSFDSLSAIGAGGSVTLRPLTSGVGIDLGLATDPIGGPLSLSNSEFGVVSAPTIHIGDANSGPISVSDAMTRSTATAINLASGGSINFTTGSIHTSGSNLMLTPGASSTVGVASDGLDASLAPTGALSFAIGSDLAIAINGASADAEYDQLNVAGIVNLTGVDLVLSGTYAPATGDTFVIVNNFSTDAVIGTFNGLDNGEIFTIDTGPLHGNYQINYNGGDGNDVVLTAINAAPAFVPDLDEIAVNDETGPFSVLFATMISSGPPRESSQQVEFIILSNTNESLFATLPSIDAAGLLTFTPNFNVAGQATITVALQDNGGTASGGSDTSAQASFTIDVAKLRVWHNARSSLDVIPDGTLAAADALEVINLLNAFGSLPVPDDGRPFGPYYDTDGDGTVSANDALDVINYLNAFGPGPTPDGEGEPPLRSPLPAPLATSHQPLALPTDLLTLLALDATQLKLNRRNHHG